MKRMLFNAAMANEDARRAGRKSALTEIKHALFDRLVFSKVRERFGGKLRWAVSGGAAISRDVAEFIDKLGILVLEGYGLTETAPVVSVNAPTRGAAAGRARTGAETSVTTTTCPSPT